MELVRHSQSDDDDEVFVTVRLWCGQGRCFRQWCRVQTAAVEGSAVFYLCTTVIHTSRRPNSDYSAFLMIETSLHLHLIGSMTFQLHNEARIGLLSTGSIITISK